ncbi:MAG TPA: peptidoglycan-associated lipoprotein Pal [Gammaproteobacteria bacterium]|nr:peptidoglycan-associated lipoprotein Pal [Gammaproteobacteria bacterium]
MARLSVLTGSLIVAVALAACSKSNTLPDLQSGTDVEGDAGATTSGVGSNGGIGEEGLSAAPQGDLLNQLVVYFDYDKNEIRPEFNAMLAAHAQFLASHPNAQVRLEGHADERGSREYNIGLGERRAQAVRRVLMLQGASAEQLSTVSYGEERPVATGHDEASYQMNRRVEIVYRQ